MDGSFHGMLRAEDGDAVYCIDSSEIDVAGWICVPGGVDADGLYEDVDAATLSEVVAAVAPSQRARAVDAHIALIDRQLDAGQHGAALNSCAELEAVLLMIPSLRSRIRYGARRYLTEEEAVARAEEALPSRYAGEAWTDWQVTNGDPETGIAKAGYGNYLIATVHADAPYAPADLCSCRPVEDDAAGRSGTERAPSRADTCTTSDHREDHHEGHR